MVVVPSVGGGLLVGHEDNNFRNSNRSGEDSKAQPDKRPVCEEIQRRIRNIQHKVGKMSLIDPTRHKRKSTFFTPTPATSTSTPDVVPSNVAKLNFNVKNPKKALLEKLLDPGDRLVQTVQLEGQWVRKLCIVCHGSEYCLLGADFYNNEQEPPTIGLVVKILWDTKVSLDGDGGFSVRQFCERQQHYIFKPVSVQALWTVIQTLHMIAERLIPKRNSLEVNKNDWVNKYVQKIGSNQTCVNEWHMMADLLVKRPVSPDRISLNGQESSEQVIRSNLREIMKTADLDTMTSKVIRIQLEDQMERNLETYKSFIDKEILVILGQMDPASKIQEYLYLGSEWNASNLDELSHNGITHILNVTREIDNFFPGNFRYLNVRVYDEEATDLLKHFNSTYTFIKEAKNNGGKVLVHCKMGISRSASVTISFLMKENEWNLDTAMFRVKKARSIVSPNKSFIKQLKVYEGILGAIRHRRVYQGLFRSKSESSLVPREDVVDGPRAGAGKSSKRKIRKSKGSDLLDVPGSFPKSSPISTPKRPISEPWNSSNVWRPKSWSPNERTAQILLDSDDQFDDIFDTDIDVDDEKSDRRCRCFDHFNTYPVCDNLSSASEEDANKPGLTLPESSETPLKSGRFSLTNLSRSAPVPPVNADTCDCDQMEFELCVPTEPVSVSQNKVDPATDVIVQNLSIFPLQLRTKLNLNNKHQGHYSSSSSASSFTSSVPSTPIFAPKRQNSGNAQSDENESDAKSEMDEPKSGEVLSVKTLANMFDFKSVSHVPTFKPSAAKLEDSKIFQRAARLCEESSQISGDQVNLLKPSESEIVENQFIQQED